MEIREEVKTYRVNMICECGGEMIAEGRKLLTYPAQYPHKCEKCGKSENYLKIYPFIEYEII